MKEVTGDAFRRLQEFNNYAAERINGNFSINQQVVGSLNMCWKPPMDVFYSEDTLVIMIDIAGVRYCAHALDTIRPAGITPCLNAHRKSS